MMYKENIPFFEEGINVPRLSFSGGRVAVDLAPHGGLSQIFYYGNQRIHKACLFKADNVSAWMQLFKVFAEIGDDLYNLEFNNTSIYPYGYVSHCDVAELKLKHSMTLLNDAIVFSVDILENPRNVSINLKMSVVDGYTPVTFPGREWSKFSFDELLNAVTVTIEDNYPAATKNPDAVEMLTQCAAFGNEETDSALIIAGVTSDKKLSFYHTPHPFLKTYITTEAVNDSASFAIVFGNDKEDFQKKIKHLGEDCKSECALITNKFQKQLRDQPEVNVENKTLQSFLTCFNGIIESEKVKDIPGGMRAADSQYWIWGWDSIVHSDANMLANDHSFVLDMLRFYREKCHPELGIFHSMSTDGKPLMAMAPPAQCLYAVMLYNYFVFTRDKAVLDEFYPFAAEIMNRARSKQINDSGMIEGVALYPDYPEHLGQNGKDISTFNNSIFFQGLKCMEKLAAVREIESDVKMYHKLAEKTKNGFEKYLYDDEKGYFVDSVSSVDFSKRFHYPIYAILWATPFAVELVEGKIDAIADFMDSNFRHKHGVSLYPRWDNGFMADGNQLGVYMPVIEGFFRQMMKMSGKIDKAGLVDIIEWAWQQITVPEALSCETVNNGITLDNPGIKQAFSAKNWYSLFFSTLSGLEFDLEGITVSTPLLNKCEIRNINFAGKSINVEIVGNGQNIKELLVNGQLISDNKIAFDQLLEDNTILVKKG